MKTKALAARAGKPASVVNFPIDSSNDRSWTWVDIELEPEDTGDDLDVVLAGLGLDPLAIHDAVADFDLPKLDDFDDHLLVVLHGLSDLGVQTYELDCFLTTNTLITVHTASSPSIDAFAAHVCRNPDLAAGGADELLGRLADVMGRRFLALADQLDLEIERLTEMALRADAAFLESLTILRSQSAETRGVLRPQREVLDQLRQSLSPVLSEAGKRRFSDVYDVAERTVQEFEAARTATSEALGAYQGAEARKATEVNKVLTIYAAIMLPLSLIAGIFGMNFVNLPAADNENGWLLAVGLMAAVALGSLAVFTVVGWIRLPSARRASVSLGNSLVDAARVPAQVVGALYEVSTSPIRHGAARLGRHSDD